MALRFINKFGMDNQVLQINVDIEGHKESGTFTSNTYLHLRYGAKPYSSTLMYAGPGLVIKYDAWSSHNGFVYVRQPRGNGQYAYVAVRNAQTNEPYGTFK